MRRKESEDRPIGSVKIVRGIRQCVSCTRDGKHVHKIQEFIITVTSICPPKRSSRRFSFLIKMDRPLDLRVYRNRESHILSRRDNRKHGAIQCESRGSSIASLRS